MKLEVKKEKDNEDYNTDLVRGFKRIKTLSYSNWNKLSQRITTLDSREFVEDYDTSGSLRN